MRSIRNFVELIILTIVVVAALYTQRVWISDWIKEKVTPDLPVAMEYREVKKEEVKEGEDVKKEKSEVQVEIVKIEEVKEILEALPLSFNLAVPFTSQAPFGEWSPPYKEACEETSLLMVHRYFQGVKEATIDADVAVAEINKIVDFEMGLFGFYEDTTIEQIGTLAELMYGYTNYEIIKAPTIDQIKTHIAAGRPVIVPAAGRELGNPFYTAPGPVYHMFVIRGYTQDGFITNDPGTKHGEAYVYPFETLMNAIHDWNGGEEITEGKIAVLALYP